MKFTLAIVGRPNVGKSTLFNRLAGKKLAIVDNTPGVTRDWREAEGHLMGETFRIIDTAGLEESFDDSIPGRMRKKTEDALAEADAVLFIIDGRASVTPLDKHFADWLRRQGKPVILGVNKCESESATAAGIGEAWSLGLGTPIPLSAEHNIGFGDLFDALKPLFPEDAVVEEEEKEYDILADEEGLDALEGRDDFDFAANLPEEDEEKPIKLAIVGRPNVGKSTLMNAILGHERVMTGPEAGITRDAIAVQWQFGGRKIRLVDTAGMRKKGKIYNSIEKMAVEDTLRAIRLAQVVVLVLDANDMLEKQDLLIAEHILNEGRALIIVVNKWDTVDDKAMALVKLEDRMESSLAQVRVFPVSALSALHG
jgi:GTP-binding protein